jgi:hypothetical protein
MKQCKYPGCGSWALNIAPNGKYCDVHYWQVRALRLAKVCEEALRLLEPCGYDDKQHLAPIRRALLRV